MARKKKKNLKRARAMKAFWRKRKSAGKAGGLGRTVRRRRRRKAASVAAPKRRRKRRASAAPKRRRRRSSRTRITRMSRKMTRGRRRRARRSTVRMRRLGPSSMHTVSRYVRTPHSAVTVKMNPGRRRRRRRRAGGRRYRRARRARGRRGARRRYRRNPGGVIMDLVTRAVPVLVSLYGSRLLTNKIGPVLPGVSSLGSLQGPVVAGIVAGVAHFATKKVGALAKHRDAIMIGAVLNLGDSLLKAFMPASVQAAIGMGDYVQMGDYVAVGATPINDSMTLSDYIAVGGDGVEEELGLEEELGVEEELGNDLLGGMPGGASLLKRVPSQSFLEPVPARSFTKQIPAAGTSYDNPGQLYKGIFNAGFGN